MLFIEFLKSKLDQENKKIASILLLKISLGDT